MVFNIYLHQKLICVLAFMIKSNYYELVNIYIYIYMCVCISLVRVNASNYSGH